MRIKLTVPLLAAALVCTVSPGAVSNAMAATTDAVIGRLGQGCKSGVLEQFDVPNSDISVRLGATLQEQIDSGAMSADDLLRDGASFDWTVQGKSASGYCNVNGKGRVMEFKQW